MALKFIGKKLKMTRIFDKGGRAIACTAIEVMPHIVCQIRDMKKDGYSALQLGAFESSKNINKPLAGHFSKKGLKAYRYLAESRVDDTDKYKVGQEIKIDHFKEGQYVDVSGTSKGAGYQGVMRLHGFKGGPAAHGSGFHRHAGSTGALGPIRCFPGGKRAGHMGDNVVTVQNLKVTSVDEKSNMILVEGAIPGSSGSVVYISEAVKVR